MEKELKVEGIFYLKMKTEETEDEAYHRFLCLLEDANIDKLNCSIKYEANEI